MELYTKTPEIPSSIEIPTNTDLILIKKII